VFVVLFYLLVNRENWIKPMITGIKHRLGGLSTPPAAPYRKPKQKAWIQIDSPRFLCSVLTCQLTKNANGRSVCGPTLLSCEFAISDAKVKAFDEVLK